MSFLDDYNYYNDGIGCIFQGTLKDEPGYSHGFLRSELETELADARFRECRSIEIANKKLFELMIQHFQESQSRLQSEGKKDSI